MSTENPNDLKHMQFYWSEIERYLYNIVSEKMESEDNIKKQIPILSMYFSPFILELLTSEQKDKIIEYLLKIREYFINKKNYTLSNEHCIEIEKLIDEMKQYLDKIGGKIPNLAILERYENVLKQQQNEFQNKADELFGDLTTHSIKKPFNDQYEQYSKTLSKQVYIFYGLLVLLAILIFFSSYLIKITGVNTNNIWEILAFRVVISLPIIWALIFLSKQISQNKKIEQAYLHKAVIAQSYLNYIEFIKVNNLNQNNSAQEIINSLHKVSIEGLGLNPALLLDKSTVEKIPMEELLSKIIDKSIPVNNSPANKSKE